MNIPLWRLIYYRKPETIQAFIKGLSQQLSPQNRSLLLVSLADAGFIRYPWYIRLTRHCFDRLRFIDLSVRFYLEHPEARNTVWNQFAERFDLQRPDCFNELEVHMIAQRAVRCGYEPDILLFWANGYDANGNRHAA